MLLVASLFIELLYFLIHVLVDFLNLSSLYIFSDRWSSVPFILTFLIIFQVGSPMKVLLLATLRSTNFPKICWRLLSFPLKILLLLIPLNIVSITHLVVGNVSLLFHSSSTSNCFMTRF